MWKTIESAPNDGQQILVGFMGQFDWYAYVTESRGVDSGGYHTGFAPPTHWTEIPEPPKE